ncbi:MAG: hypothetical protein J1F22_02195 [Lachnospiraceae bacterium]|nr:hypothetical protein [Lachnospiraceae bacterium]
MKKRKKAMRAIGMLLMLSMAMTGCSSSNQEETATSPAISYNEIPGGTYVEQNFEPDSNLFPSEDNSGMDLAGLQGINGEIYFYAEKIGKKSDEEGMHVIPEEIALVKYEGEKAVKVDCPWAKAVKKFRDKNKLDLMRVYMGQDGKLYQELAELKDDAIEKEYLLQIDLQTNQWKEIPLPKLPKNDNGKGVTWVNTDVFADGNVLIQNGSTINGIYNPLDGRCIRELENPAVLKMAGNGEYFSFDVDMTTGLPTKIVSYSEKSGEKGHEISLAALEERDASNPSEYVRYFQDSFYYITRGGIYRADIDEDSFTRIVSKNDRVLKLGSNNYMVSNLLVDGINEGFYVTYYENHGTYDRKMCYYKKQE